MGRNQQRRQGNIKSKRHKKQSKRLKKVPNSQKNLKHQHFPSSKKTNNLTLRERMLEKLRGARFRYINEQMYTTTSKNTQQIFKSDSNLFNIYHEGYRQQIEQWPLNPLDVIIKSIKKMPKTHIVADFGCGEALLAKSVQQQVYSFDFIALNDKIIPCDMAHVPLSNDTIDVAVFCLSLMTTNLNDYLIEANRVLKLNGILKIAEVESRVQNVTTFVKSCEQFGFKKISMDLSNNLFYFIDFKKTKSFHNNNKKQKGCKVTPKINLMPCLYKKR